MPNYQLLVNADDFGRHVLIDQAVKRCVEDGCLRSATLMPGGKAFDDAVEVARCHPELGVGIHLTLVNGFPVCEAKDIPSLVTKEGVFFDNHVEFVKHFLKGQYAPRANPTPFSKSPHVHCRLLIFSIDRIPQGGVVYG